MLNFVLSQLRLLKLVFWDMEAYKLLIGNDVSEKVVAPYFGIVVFDYSGNGGGILLLNFRY